MTDHQTPEKVSRTADATERPPVPRTESGLPAPAPKDKMEKPTTHHQLPWIIEPNGLPDKPLDTAFTLTDPNTVHHVRNVLRLKPGHRLILVDGQTEQPYGAEIKAVSRQGVLVVPIQPLAKPPANGLPTIHLGAALIKGQRWEWLLQKVTELGGRHIHPLETQRAVVQIGGAQSKQQRWGSVCQSAAEQSEALFIPTVHRPSDLTNFIDATAHVDLKVVLTERGDGREPFRLFLRKHVAIRTLALAIGPEGGWTPEELSVLRQHQFHPVSLGQQILRAETAAIAAMSGLVFEFGA